MITTLEAEEAVNFWVGRLRHLGLTGWDFTVEVVEEMEEDHEDSYAYCETHEFYDSATITFSQDIPEKHFNRVVVHELLHCVMRDFWEIITVPTYELAKGEGQLLRNQMRHEEEGVVDRIARTIVADLT